MNAISPDVSNTNVNTATRQLLYRNLDGRIVNDSNKPEIIYPQHLGKVLDVRA